MGNNHFFVIYAVFNQFNVMSDLSDCTSPLACTW